MLKKFDDVDINTINMNEICEITFLKENFKTCNARIYYSKILKIIYKKDLL